LKSITLGLLDDLSRQARSSKRLRINHNLHDHLGDKIQRLLNAMEPGTYVQPHRHKADRWEYFQLIRGEALIVLFDVNGRVVEKIHLSPANILAIEIPGGCFHTISSLAPQTVLWELKPGPYHADSDKEFARWAPSENQESVGQFLAWFESSRKGDLPPS